jgi:hypothetical protein
MKEITKQLLTGKDNQTYDLGRVSWVVCLIAVIAFSIYAIATKSAFSLREFGEAVATIVGVHSAGIWAKKDTEPSFESPPQDNTK